MPFDAGEIIATSIGSVDGIEDVYPAYIIGFASRRDAGASHQPAYAARWVPEGDVGEKSANVADAPALRSQEG